MALTMYILLPWLAWPIPWVEGHLSFYMTAVFSPAVWDVADAAEQIWRLDKT